MATNKFLLLLLMILSCFVDGMMPIANTNSQQQLRPTLSIEQQQDRENKQFLASLRIRALHNLQRSLESLSSLTANSLMLNAALQSSESADEEENDAIDNDIGEEMNNSNKLDEATMMATIRIRSKDRQPLPHNQPPADASVLDLQHISTSPPFSFSQHSSGVAFYDTKSDELQAIRAHRHGVRRIRADLKQMPSIQDEMRETTRTTPTEMPTANARGEELSGEKQPTLRRNQRRMRSTRQNGHGNHHNSVHHKRRRKGCPTVHGKDQLLCPTRNTHRYDVCITREQLCDRIRDCPGGEDEDSRHCFFFRPLETSLKTISHAVLLLVDTVMREQEEHQQKIEQPNEF